MNADELAKILDELGQRLGPTGEYVFGLAVRQVYVDAAVSLVALLVVAVIGAVAIPRVFRWVQEGDDYSDREFPAALLGGMYAAIAVIALVVAAQALPAVLNPEYAALRDLLRSIGG